MVGSRILCEVSEIDRLEVRPGDVEDQFRLDKQTTRSNTIAFVNREHWQSPRV
jgi:hypothetical protein